MIYRSPKRLFLCLFVYCFIYINVRFSSCINIPLRIQYPENPMAAIMRSIYSHLKLGIFFSVLSEASSIKYDVLGNSTNFPDPSIVNVKGVSYVFATNDGNGHNIPVTSNPHFNDPSGWSEIKDAFPTDGVPAFGDGGWAVEGTTWAPDVNHLVCGKSAQSKTS